MLKRPWKRISQKWLKSELWEIAARGLRTLPKSQDGESNKDTSLSEKQVRIHSISFLYKTNYIHVYIIHTQSKIFTYCLTNDVLVILNDTRNCRIEINIEECCGE